MTRIRTRCPNCGEIGLRPHQMRLVVVRGADRRITSRRYEFACPSCAALVVRDADGRVTQLLSGGGVAVVEESTPVVGTHPEAPDGAPPLTYEDVRAFRELLDTADWFEQLQRVV